MRVYITPHQSQIKDDNGVGRIVHAQYKHLPRFGIELVGDPDSADVIACHINGDNLPRVDVLHCHGLYWTADPGGQYDKWHHDANGRIIEAARRALAVTVPSNWVAEPFKRDMRLVPEVIGHGIDLEQWGPAEQHKGYLLWNKNRAGDVCDPTPAWALANRGATVVSTFAPSGKQVPGNMLLTGAVSHDKMRELVRYAEIYLATTQETFGVGTLEAMAAGVPVLGYRHGGTADLIEHKVTGWLVEPGDVDGLMDGLAWLRKHRGEIGAAAREFAQGYGWPAVMKQYAALYQRVRTERETAPTGVAVIISCYNYGRYVGEAIASLAAQTQPPDEVVIVDDGSTDDSLDRIHEALAETPIPGAKVEVVSQTNQGVAAARNNAIAATTQPHIVSLDADDQLAPHYIEACHKAMLADPGLGVAYTGLMLLNEDGTEAAVSAFPPPFDWEMQTTVRNPPNTCTPSASMFRRLMWERSGGYKQVYAPGEDTEFFTRGLSTGWRAKRVTDFPLFRYRAHPQGAHIAKAHNYRPIDIWHPWMRDKQYSMGAPAKAQPLVRSYSSPAVSVIVPVGPDHFRYLPACLDSLLGQSVRAWEAVVINDSGEPIPEHLRTTYPFVRWVETAGREGPGKARNVGIEQARAPLLLFLDADDYILPDTLRLMLQAHIKSNGRYVYTDWFVIKDGEAEIYETPDYSQVAWLQKGVHAVTALVPTEWAKQVGGYDESIRGWEDWDFFIKFAIAGFCGVRVSEPLLCYRHHTGTMRERSFAHKDELLDWLRERYGDYATGVKPMAGCCSGNSGTVRGAAQGLAGVRGMAPQAESGEPTVIEPEVTRLRYVGQNEGAITFKSQDGQRRYRGGNNANDRWADVNRKDVAWLLATGKWERETPFIEAPPPAAPFPETRLEEAATVPTVATMVDTQTQAGRQEETIMPTPLTTGTPELQGAPVPGRRAKGRGRKG